MILKPNRCAPCTCAKLISIVFIARENGSTGLFEALTCEKLSCYQTGRSGQDLSCERYTLHQRCRKEIVSGGPRFTRDL